MKVLKLIGVVLVIAVLAACSQRATPTTLETPGGELGVQAGSDTVGEVGFALEKCSFAS